MSYTGLNYYLLTAVTLALYALLPKKRRWLALLLGSLVFYVLAVGDALRLALFFSSIVLSWGFGLLLEKNRETNRNKRLLFLSLLLCGAPLLFPKLDVLLAEFCRLDGFHWVIPMGLAFYTLQMLSYLIDIASGKINAEKNLARYALYISFFPQILQGPIPRWSELAPQLFEGHEIREKNLREGLQLVLWGFFLKWMIADKAAILVNTVFDRFPSYQGVYVLIAGILYSLQLYTDFLACVTLSQGVAQLFGISLADNFRQPYFSRSIREFWRRWHISLSRWLKDYVYIPLGGSRRGTAQKYRNLLLTFLISGLWHGGGLKFLIWGMMHAIYQIAASVIYAPRNRLYLALQMPEDSLPRRILSTLGTCFWVMLAWIIFRANSLSQGMEMLRSLVTVWNPWVLFDGSLLQLGLPGKEWNVLLVSVAILFAVSVLQTRLRLRDWINQQHLMIRWPIYLLAIFAIYFMGTYGEGFRAQDFIYGAF